MALAWKVMLPLGLLNLVAVAIVTELIVRGEAQNAPLSMGFAVAVGWIVLVVGWVAAAVWSPLHDDNRPKMSAHEFDTEQELLAR
jgi:hypothetical protein